MGQVKLYDAKQVTMVFMGILIDSGFDEDEFLSIEPNSEDYFLVMGADGSGTRCRSNNLSAQMKLKLMQTSAGNSFLSTLRVAGFLAKNGADVGPMLVRDRLSGVTLYTAQSCWIAKAPNSTFALKSTPREWILETDELIQFVGGS